MTRKISVVYLESKEDLETLRPGQIVGTSRGFAYRENDEDPRKFWIEEEMVPVRIVINGPPIKGGSLILNSVSYSYDTITEAERRRAKENFRMLGLKREI